MHDVTVIDKSFRQAHTTTYACPSQISVLNIIFLLRANSSSFFFFFLLHAF